jgi:hypothetical protein
MNESTNPADYLIAFMPLFITKQRSILLYINGILNNLLVNLIRIPNVAQKYLRPTAAMPWRFIISASFIALSIA